VKPVASASDNYKAVVTGTTLQNKNKAIYGKLE